MQPTETHNKPTTAPVYRQKRVFIGGLDTIVGNELVERLRNEHIHPQNPNQIVGTLAMQNSVQTDKIPQGVRKIIDTTKVSFNKDVILDSDIIIYDLKFVISTLKMAETNEQKTLICISSVLTWAKTPRKIKGEEDEPDEPEPESEGEQEGEPEPEPETKEGEEPKEYVKFKDSDYALRRPLPSYETIKSLETLCLSAGRVRPTLKSYVICSGILYGKKEPFWEKYFFEAIHQTPAELSYFGQGRNRIPSIHIKDLVTFVEKTIQKCPPIPYILAVDHNPKPTQRSIIKSISRGIGTGKTNQHSLQDVPGAPQFLLADIAMRPTDYFQKLEEEEAGLEGEEGEEVDKFTFKWEFREGIQTNIKRLCEQFKESMSMKQIKVLITGPPACGKSHYSRILSTMYKLPHLHIKRVIEDVLALGEENELVTEVKTYLDDQKETLTEEARVKYEQAKQKWRKLPKSERQPLEPFSEESIRVFLSDQLLSKCYVWRLSQNDCINRGYILDSFPKTFDNAKTIFMSTPEPQEGEEVDEENPIRIINERTIPNRVFAFQAPDSKILEFLRALPQQKLDNTHLTEEDTRRRIKTYRDRNVEHTGKETLEDFFNENGIQIHKVNVLEEAHVEKLLLSTVLPLNSNEQSNQDRANKITETQEIEKKNKRAKEDVKEKVSRDIQAEDYRIKKQNEQNEEREILEKKSLALRKYLDVNMVPFLSEGIHEILKKLPQNPVDYLAQFLFKMSLQVPSPDPSETFEF